MTHTLILRMHGSRRISFFAFTRQVTAATRHCNGRPESNKARQTALIDAANSYFQKNKLKYCLTFRVMLLISYSASILHFLYCYTNCCSGVQVCQDNVIACCLNQFFFPTFSNTFFSQKHQLAS